MKKKTIFQLVTVLIGFICLTTVANAQTADDAIMMSKKQWCNGVTYMYSNWHRYWEGTHNRENLNLGTVKTQSVMLMSNYGISDKLNVIVSAPYIWTAATAGTLHGLKGFQDITLDLKYEFYTAKVGHGRLSFIGVGSGSIPLTNYQNDFLPMSIGLGCKTLTARLTADYQNGIFFSTISSGYVFRGNVNIDRTAYYTDQIHYTNEVNMSNQLMSNLNVGIRKKNLIVQAILMNLYTFGGYDIRTNDMPFANNQMNMTSLGVHLKYFIPFVPNLQVVGGADYVIEGRNVGQAQTYSGGLYYIFSL